MSLLYRVCQLFDRPGGRTLLGWVTTRMYRKLSGRDVSIFWDGSWFLRDGSDYVSDAVQFNYTRQGLLQQKARRDQAIENSRDYWFYRYKPKSGDVIVDIGAGNGNELALFSKSVGEKGIVLAVEAHPKTFDRLKKTCHYSKLQNVLLRQYAVSESRGKVSIEDCPNNEMNAISLTPNPADILVDSISIDELCSQAGIGRVNFLKMNIEGAEQFAILGMKSIIKNTDFVAIACHDFRAVDENDTYFRTRALVSAFLVENGFFVENRSDDSRSYVQDHVHAWRPTHT
ncbi:MAG: FkbM family methyltransferase [Planctomycetota bacterium]|nr:FkbM family methyltransferase [Planctomycetota bacterium]